MSPCQGVGVMPLYIVCNVNYFGEFQLQYILVSFRGKLLSVSVSPAVGKIFLKWTTWATWSKIITIKRVNSDLWFNF